jgi:hypothetical protein
MNLSEDRWAIIDDKGIIYESGDEEMIRAEFERPQFDWEGDLLLVKILERKR